MVGSINSVEVLGYIASVLIAISFVMKSIKKLRLFNIVGATLFVVYSIIIRAWPVALINLFSIGINIYRLVQENDSN